MLCRGFDVLEKQHFPMIRPFLLAGSLSLLLIPLGAAAETPAPLLPRKLLPSRGLPPEYENQYSGLVTGDLCLIKATPADPYQPSTIAKCYRWSPSLQLWQQVTNHLPFTTWPESCQNGMLEYLVRPPEGGMPTRTIVDAQSGLIVWSDLPLGMFQASRDYVAVFGNGEIQVRDRLGATQTIAVAASPYAHDSKLNGDELAWVTHSGSQDSVTRVSLSGGRAAETWTYPGGFTKIAGVCGGKVLIYSGSAAPLLLLPGQQAPVSVALPPAYLPDAQPLWGSLESISGFLSTTPQGAWLRGSFYREGMGHSPIALHLNLSGSGPANWDRVATGAEITALDGAQLLVLPDWASGRAVVDGSISSLPVVRLGKARGSELSGLIEVPVLLDRPAAGQVAVRVRTGSGGSAGSADYTAKDELVQINGGQLEGKFLIPLKADQVAERNETISLEVVEATGAIVVPETTGFAVIEASGVNRSHVADPPMLTNWPVNAPTDLVGGDGLRYRILITPTAIPTVEVSEPANGTVLEHVVLTGLRPGTHGFYSAFLAGTPGGVRYHFMEDYDHQAWDLSGSRSTPGIALKVNPPVEGGISGHLEFSLMEPFNAALPVSWKWSVPRKSNGSPGANLDPSFEPTGSIVVPADGSMVAKSVWMRSYDITDRVMPMLLEVSDATEVREFALVDPGMGEFRPKGTTLTGDPAVSPSGYTSATTIGDRLYLGNTAAKDAEGRMRGCVQIFDMGTGAHVRTILPPPTLTHNGFGYAVAGDAKDLFITALEYPNLPKMTAKIGSGIV